MKYNVKFQMGMWRGSNVCWKEKGIYGEKLQKKYDFMNKRACGMKREPPYYSNACCMALASQLQQQYSVSLSICLSLQDRICF